MDTEYIAPYSIRAGVETIRHGPQLHNLLNFSPALPTLTFYGPPSPSSRGSAIHLFLLFVI